MKKESKFLDIGKRVLGTIYIPALMYILITIIAKANGITYFGDGNTLRNIVLDTAATATIAYALATQIKNGRFDFSGGAIMTLGALVSIYFASNHAHDGVAFLVINVIVCMVLSLLVAVFYTFGKIPIIICTVGAAIFFESLTLIFNGGQGATISNDAALNFLGKKMGPSLVLVCISAVIYFVYHNLTRAGKQSDLLANNQLAAVNIGIHEKRNVIGSFLVSGALYGIASVVFASQSFQIDVVTSVLGTVSTAFGAMLPVFMGFYIGSFSTGAVGILFSSLTVGILDYGIKVIAPTGYAGAFKNVVMALFMVFFYLASRKGPKIVKWMEEKRAWKDAAKKTRQAA